MNLSSIGWGSPRLLWRQLIAAGYLPQQWALLCNWGFGTQSAHEYRKVPLPTLEVRLPTVSGGSRPPNSGTPVARQIGADMTCHLDRDLYRVGSVLMGEPKRRRCPPPLLGWQTVYDSANDPVMSTDKLKSLGTRTLSLWRIVKLFRDVGAKGVPIITAEVKQKTVQILDTLDPVTRMVSQINEPGYADKHLH